MKDMLILEKYASWEDFSAYWMLVSNEMAMQMNYGRVFTQEEAKYLYEYMLKINQEQAAYGYFKVFLKTTNEYIGLGAAVLNEDDMEAEIEYMLFPEYWGVGYGSGIVDVLLEKIKEPKTIKQVTAIVELNNLASKKILTNHGFFSQKIYETEDGSLAESFIKKL